MNLELKEKGFVKLEGVFSPSFLESWKVEIKSTDYYEELLSFKIDVPLSKAINLHRVKVSDLGVLVEPRLREIFQDQKYQDIITSLIGSDVVRANSQFFEIGPGSDAGLNWHTGYYSFAYVDELAPCYTLWIPLDPIQEQKGGMQYIPKNELDGGFIYKFAKWYYLKLSGLDSKEDYRQESMRDEYLVNSIDKFIDYCMPKENICEYSFNLGDALLFEKRILHKSSELLEGKLKSRSAVVCRFFDIDARLDLKNHNLLRKHVERQFIEGNSRIDNVYEKLKNRYDPFMKCLFAKNLKHGSQIKTYLESEAKHRFLICPA